MSKKITWTKQSVFQYFCWYILFSSIVNIGVIAIFIWKNYDFRIINNFDGTLATILSLLGVFITFTAINSYSSFNARVEDEKQKLEEVKTKYNENIVSIERKFKDYYEELDNLKCKYDNFKGEINKNLNEINDYYNLKYDVFDVKNSVVLLDKVHAIYALTERIERIKKSIDETDSIGERKRLEEDLSSLKNIIKRELEPYYCKLEEIENKTYRGIFNDFKALLGEESVV